MSQKTVLITGCSDGGIGAALAAEFHRRGCRVFATARNVDKMQSLRALGIEAVAMDVTSDASIEKAVAEVGRAASGSLDLLVNNAGVHHFMPFADSRPEDFRRVIDTNVTAVFVVTHAFLPLLIRSRGVVANIGSVQEVFCLPFQSAYNASKAAVHAMAHTLRVELKPLGVRFVTVVTGGVKTRLYDNAPVELPAGSQYAPIARKIEGREFIHNVRRDDADDYARAVVADLLRPEPRWTLWHGSQSTLAWLLSWFGWDGMIFNIRVMRIVGSKRFMKMSPEKTPKIPSCIGSATECEASAELAGLWEYCGISVGVILSDTNLWSKQKAL